MKLDIHESVHRNTIMKVTNKMQLYRFFLTTHCSREAYCAILVRRSNFRHQAFQRVSPRDSTQRRKVELWARNVRYFCLNSDFHVTFSDLLHAVKLRHGTALLPLRRKACWGFFRPKNPMASARCEPANLGIKGQHATSRQSKPQLYRLMYYF